MLFISASAFGVEESSRESECDPLGTLGLTKRRGVTVHYYSVSAQSLSDLHQEIRRRGPVDQYGKSRDALTKWKLRWRWVFEPGTKNVKDVKLSSSVDLYFPFWKECSILKTPKELGKKREWQRYVRALAEHELQHVQFFRTGLERFDYILKARIALERPLSLKEAKKIADLVVEELRTQDREFDERTNHGMDLGVVLGSD